MGFRFRRSIKLMPGVRLNLSPGGISTSFGVRGLRATVGKSGTRTTVGLPGTGMSYSVKHDRKKKCKTGSDNIEHISLSDEVPAMETNQGIWFVHINGEPRGPFSADALRQALAHGTISDQDWIWREGLANWISIQELTQFDPLKASTPTRWQKMRRHLGSTLALILGCLYFLSGINAASRAEHTEGFIGGPIVILGAIAYSSAKKRKLGEVKSTLTRKCFEVVILLFICFLAFARNDLIEAMYTHPVQSLFVPVWALLAYLIITLVPRRWLGSRQEF